MRSRRESLRLEFAPRSFLIVKPPQCEGKQNGADRGSIFRHFSSYRASRSVLQHRGTWGHGLLLVLKKSITIGKLRRWRQVSH
jgi:hypothetical protein